MATAEVHWRPLGTLLVERGLLSAEELEDALNAQQQTGKRLGEILVERGLVSRPALSDTLARQYGIELASESGFGTGLRALIDRRHAAGRLHVLPAPSTDESVEAEAETPDLEDFLHAPGQLIALEPQLEEHWARLAAAEATVAERDTCIEELEQELAERGAEAATQTKALNRRLGALRKELAERERKAASLATEIGLARAARDRATGELEAHAGSVREELARLHEQADERLEDLRERLEAAQLERETEQTRGQQLHGEIDVVRKTLEERQAELNALQAELDSERARRDASELDRDERFEDLLERLEAAQRERDEEQTRGRQVRGEIDAVRQTLEERQGELRSLQAELDSERAGRDASQRERDELAERLREEADSLRDERDALAAEVAEARSALADATEHASEDSRVEPAVSDRAREEQRRTVETLAVVLDEIRRDRDTVRDVHSEAEGQLAALSTRIAELEQERDEQARELADARLATEAARQAAAATADELGSVNDDRAKLAQLVKKLGDEQSDRKRLLAEVEQEREQRADLVPQLEALQREVAASEQRLATAAIQVLGERRRQDEERRRAEAAEAAARRYKHRLSELEQSGTVPA